jgi:hypothetical protein
VFHEILVGRRLFQSSDDLECLRLVREAQIFPPSRLRADVPPEVDAIVMRMLARTADARFASCDDVVTALAPIVTRTDPDGRARAAFAATLLPELASTAIPVRKLDVPLDSLGGTIDLDLSLTRPRRRRGAIAITLGTALMLSVAFMWSARHQNTPAPTLTSPVTAAAPAPLVPPVPPTPMTPPAPAVRVHLNVKGPASAEAVLDGTSLGHLPVAIELSRTTGTRVLVVRRPGYLPMTRALRGDEDSTVTASLKPVSEARHRDHQELVGGVFDPFATKPSRSR